MKIPAMTVNLPVSLKVGDGDPEVIGTVPATLTAGPAVDTDDDGTVMRLVGDAGPIALSVADLLEEAAMTLRAEAATE